MADIFSGPMISSTDSGAAFSADLPCAIRLAEMLVFRSRTIRVLA